MKQPPSTADRPERRARAQAEPDPQGLAGATAMASPAAAATAQAMAHDSPRLRAQRAQWPALFGAAAVVQRFYVATDQAPGHRWVPKDQWDASRYELADPQPPGWLIYNLYRQKAKQSATLPQATAARTEPKAERDRAPDKSARVDTQAEAELEVDDVVALEPAVAAASRKKANKKLKKALKKKEKQREDVVAEAADAADDGAFEPVKGKRDLQREARARVDIPALVALIDNHAGPAADIAIPFNQLVNACMEQGVNVLGGIYSKYQTAKERGTPKFSVGVRIPLLANWVIHVHCDGTGATAGGKNPIHYKRLAEEGQTGVSIELTGRQEAAMLPPAAARLAYA